MQLVALRDWYPRFGSWTGRLVPESDRVGWVIHHTVGGTGQDPEAYAQGVADYHYGRWGVPGGYNYLIGEDGVVRVMCGLAFRGVHSGTHEWNRKSLGLAFQGDFRIHPPSESMLDAARELIADTPIPSDQWGHRDVRPEPTSCPGKQLYDLLPLEVTMPLTDQDIERIWQHTIPDQDDNIGRRGLAHAIKQSWKYSIEAARDAAVTRRIVENLNDPQSDPLTASQIDAIADEVADELHERLGA